MSYLTREFIIWIIATVMTVFFIAAFVAAVYLSLFVLQYLGLINEVVICGGVGGCDIE